MVEINGERLTLEQIESVSMHRSSTSVSEDALLRCDASRQIIERIVQSGEVVYGVNTGFGRLATEKISSENLEELQLNLVRSHACGVGPPLSRTETRAMLLLRANVLAKGHSGCRRSLVSTLIAMLERGVHPVIPEQGSVGASGDLAPLAHLALVVIGEGEAEFEGNRIPGGDAMSRADISPIALQAKEGLSLLNGTQAICAIGSLALARSRRVMRAAEIAAAMTLEALKGTPTAFDSDIQRVRPQRNQGEVAERMRTLLRDSEIRESHRTNDARVQDAYSLRCIPQVHGASISANEYAIDVVECESGCATDNPLVFAESGSVVSGGNFHGAPVAQALDFAAIGLADIISISERRIDRLVNPDTNEGLPAFLASDPGLGSGFMIAHVTAAALLNEAKMLAHPASVDNVPTSGGKEDHVSMGVTSALKFRRLVDAAERCIAIELLAAAEGIEYRRPLRAGVGVEFAFEILRGISPRLDRDRPLSSDIENVATAIRDGKFAAVG